MRTPHRGVYASSMYVCTRTACKSYMYGNLCGLYGSFVCILEHRLIQSFNGGGLDLLSGNGTCVGSLTYKVVFRRGRVVTLTRGVTLATGCAYALIYVQFVHLVLGNESGGIQLVYEGTCCLAWGVIFDRRRDKGVVCVFSIFNAGGCVCGCRCVYTHTRTHTAHMGYSDVSPGVGMRHLEGPKNLDGLHLGIYVFAYVCKVHMCMYMLRGRMRFWTNCFFL